MRFYINLTTGIGVRLEKKYTHLKRLVVVLTLDKKVLSEAVRKALKPARGRGLVR